MNKDTQSNKIEPSKELTNYFLFKREDTMRMESNLKLLAIYVLFISRARWNGSWFSPTGKPLKVGQFFFGNQELATKLGCDVKTVRRLVHSLDTAGYITLDDKTNFGSIGTICNLGLISTLKTQSLQSRSDEGTPPWEGVCPPEGTLTNHVTKKPIKNTCALPLVDDINKAISGYPKRDGRVDKGKAVLKFKALVEKGTLTISDLTQAVDNYRKCCDSNGHTGTQFVMMMTTFANGDLSEWVNYRSEHDDVVDELFGKFMEASNG